MKTTTPYLFWTTWLLMLSVSIQTQIVQAQPSDSGPSNSQKNFLVFDGDDAYADCLPLLGNLPKATMMGWIKLDETYNTTATIMGQDNLSLKVNVNGNKKQLCAAAQNQLFTTEVLLDTQRWYHVAVVYDAFNSEQMVVYLNGAKVKTIHSLQNSSLAPSHVNFTVAKNPVFNSEYFKGGIDEVRVFDTALSEDQLHKMVYQEIKANGNALQGETVPKDIEGLNWSSLIAYFRMDAAHEDRITNFGHSTTTDTDASSLVCHNTLNFQPQSAPMPFVTHLSGNLEQAVAQENAVSGADVRMYPWSILQINHIVDLTANLSCLSMTVAADANVRLTNNNKLENTWYLKLNGKIDLQGQSQLIQTEDSTLDPNSIGYIKRDQQGQSNLYNYNYWCAPVGSIGMGNNNNFTVDGILRDGTDTQNPVPINWSNGLNGSPTTPITLSAFWIFKFQNQSQSYANWTSVGPYGTFQTAQAFTLKGCGSTAPNQNLSFIGKPNNGVITLPIAHGNMNLTGNPYPSALDADAFINANKMVTNGTLYFWEQFATNTSHQLADYQGGYATRNLVGGVPPVAPSGISGLGSSDRIPQRFIPVGQGFFVQANNTGGVLTFDNSQRAFMKENASQSNTLFRTGDAQTSTEHLANANDDIEDNQFAKIRLGFTSANNFHRQVLLGFMNENASSAMESGYDAHNIDTVPNDLYLMKYNYKLVIEGEGYFNDNLVYPLGVKSGTLQTVTFVLDGTENFNGDQPIYLYDALTDQYHDIRIAAFSVELPQGTVLNRFSLRFRTDEALATQAFANEPTNEIEMAYNDNQQQLQLQNNNANVAINTVDMYDLRAQIVGSWQVDKPTAAKINLQVQDLSTGTYVVKIHTSQSAITRKILIK